MPIPIRRPVARTIGLSALAATTLLLGACASSSDAAEDVDLLEQAQERGYIDIGVFNNPPQSSIDPETGEWVGIDADIARAVGEELDIEFRPHVYDLAAIITALESGRIDMIDALAQTPERTEVVAFSDQPMWWSPIDIVVDRTPRSPTSRISKG